MFESDEAGEMVCGAMGDEDLSQTVAVLEGIRFNLLEGRAVRLSIEIKLAGLLQDVVIHVEPDQNTHGLVLQVAIDFLHAGEIKIAHKEV